MTANDFVLALLGTATLPLAGFVWISLRGRSEGLLGSRSLEALAVGPTLTVLALQVAFRLGLGPRSVSVAVLSLAVACLLCGGFRAARCAAQQAPIREPMNLVAADQAPRGRIARSLILSLPVLLALCWAVSTAPLTGDPAELWASKAAAFKYMGALDLAPLGAPEVVARRNPFHPVGFPLLMDQTLAWLPRFEPMLCRLPSVFFLLVLLVLADRGLAGVLRPWPRIVPVLALGFLPAIIEQGFDGHADVPLAVTLLASWLALTKSSPPPTDPRGRSTGTGRSVPMLAGLLAGGAALLKLEGVAAPFVGAALLTMGRRWRELPPFAVGSVVPLLMARLVLAVGAGSGGPGLLDPRLYLEYVTVLVDRIRFIGVEGSEILWALPTPILLFGCALVAAALLPGHSRRTSRFLLTASALWLLCVSASYLLHPQFEFQVRAHQRRAFLQVLPALWIAGSIGLFAAAQPGVEDSLPP